MTYRCRQRMTFITTTASTAPFNDLAVDQFCYYEIKTCFFQNSTAEFQRMITTICPGDADPHLQQRFTSFIQMPQGGFVSPPRGVIVTLVEIRSMSENKENCEDILRIGQKLALYGTFLCNRFKTLNFILMHETSVTFTGNTPDLEGTSALFSSVQSQALVRSVKKKKFQNHQQHIKVESTYRAIFIILIFQVSCSNKPYDPKPEISITVAHSQSRKQR